MTLIAIQDGKVVLKDGKVGTEQDCCCGGGGECTAWLKFTACYGSGASAYATLDESGVVTGVALASAGSGYATPFRVQPTLTISGSGTGATFTPTLVAEENPPCGLARWRLPFQGISVTGGTGYTDEETLTIGISGNDTAVINAVARLYVGREAPTVTLSGNATTTVNLVQQQPEWWTRGFWYVSSVTVTSGGSGYSEGQGITINKAVGDIETVGNSAFARVVHDEPANAVFSITGKWVYDPDSDEWSFVSSSGSGAILEPVWELLDESEWPAPHKKTYRLAGVTVTDGGSGYEDREIIEVSFAAASDGEVLEQAYIDTGIVGGSGEIVAAWIADPADPETETPAGKYVGSQTDALHSVDIGTGPLNGGRYYRPTGVPDSVSVSAEGIYYGEDESAAPHKAGVSAVLPSNLLGQGGVAASFSVAVGDDGGISGITVSGSGSGYEPCCGPCSNTATAPCYCCQGQRQVNCLAAPYLCDFSNAHVVDDGAEFLRESYLLPITFSFPAPFVDSPQWAAGYPDALGQCDYRWSYQYASQKVAYTRQDGCFAYRTWIQYRLFVVNCTTRTLADVTDQALSQSLQGTVCTWGPSPNQPGWIPGCDSSVCNENPAQNPGFLTLSPTLSCP